MDHTVMAAEKEIKGIGGHFLIFPAL